MSNKFTVHMGSGRVTENYTGRDLGNKPGTLTKAMRGAATENVKTVHGLDEHQAKQDATERNRSRQLSDALRRLAGK